MLSYYNAPPGGVSPVSYTHLDVYKRQIKPMNCPGGMLVYKNEPHSYRDLPLRMAELGIVHRHELSGALHGLFRVRCFTQDDAHIFMTPEQMKDEIKGVVKIFDEIYSTFALTYKIELSTMPEDHMGDEATWRDVYKRQVLGYFSAWRCCGFSLSGSWHCSQ